MRSYKLKFPGFYCNEPHVIRAVCHFQNSEFHSLYGVPQSSAVRSSYGLGGSRGVFGITPFSIAGSRKYYMILDRGISRPDYVIHLTISGTIIRNDYSEIKRQYYDDIKTLRFSCRELIGYMDRIG